MRPLPATRRYVEVVTLFGFVACALAIYIISMHGANISSDARANSFAAWHMARTGSPFLDGDHYPKLPGPDYFPIVNGHTVVARTPGQIWAAVPFYLFPPSRYVTYDPVGASMAAAVWTTVGMALLFAGLRRLLGFRLALAATLSVAFATPVWPVAAQTLWPHCITILGISAAIFALSRKYWFVAGLAFGLGILARPHVAVIAAVVGLGLAWTRRSPRIAVMVGAGSGLLMSVLLMWNRYVFGRWSLSSGLSQTVADVVPGTRQSRLGYDYWQQWGGFLFSMGRGFVIWTPLALILAIVAWRNRDKIPDWVLWLAGGGVVYSAVQLALDEFTGGGGFAGYRLGLELLVCVTPLCALGVTYLPGRKMKLLVEVLMIYQAAIIAVSAIVHLPSVPESQLWWNNSFILAFRDRTSLSLAVAGGMAFLVIGACAFANPNRSVFGRWQARVKAPGQVHEGPTRSID